ncbi:MAG: Bcr/CflA family efflux MFS transporter [Desulfovibrionaceae bacterium]|jgi:DHA1 family bicyclomycin/chloramphenicol resistance-like MFS transporter|nr:Bcr/CflA family efflux MFS transporter [Desulfovibrionaceae bacterium]
MQKKQRFYGDRTIIALLALLSAFPPLSTDLYLPALPHMMEVLRTSQSLVNLTLSLFLVSFAVGMLVWGPMSEKYGRKPILLIGLALYAAGGAGCALSTHVVPLIASRMIQAFGGGAAGAVATAIVKDLYDGRRRESVLAVVMSMVVVAPVVAPVLGAVLLKFMPWTAIFWLQAGVGLAVLALSLLLDETLEERYSGSLAHSLGRLFVVLRNPGFSVLLGTFSLVPLPLMAFIGASAFIYTQGFGMTESRFSYFFAFNALGSLVGPLLYLRLSLIFSSRSIITFCFCLLAACGAGLALYGGTGPIPFALTMATATISISMMRPPTANMLLSQQKRDTGSAAALINFMGMFMGSVGMFLISLEPGDPIPVLGLMQILVGGTCGGLWLLLRRRSFIRQEDGRETPSGPPERRE